MKKRNLFFIVLALVFSGQLFTSQTVNAQTHDNPGEYMGELSEHYKELQKDMWDYVKAVGRGKGARKIDNKRSNLISTMNLAIIRIKKMKGYEGDTGLRDSTIHYLEINKLALQEDYAKIVDMEEIAEQSYDLMEEYLTAKSEVNKKLDQAGEMLRNESQRFADTYGVNLIENESKLGKKIANASSVIEYYNEIYLIFFKCSVQDAYLMEAVQNGDVNGIEQNNSSLLTYAEEGKTQLRTIKTFEGDNTLKLACTETLKFYENESKKQIPVFTDYFLKKDNFDQIKAAFDVIPKRDRTQEDVDKYNNSINEFNESLNKFNDVNQEMNKGKTKMINKWNKNTNKFMDSHI